MAELRVRTIDESELDTVLGADMAFDGELEVETPVLVKGQLEGTIRSSSDVYIAEGADIRADLYAERASIRGLVRGNVVAAVRVELFPGARIHGDVATPDLIVQSGGRITGHCDMGGIDA